MLLPCQGEGPIGPPLFIMAPLAIGPGPIGPPRPLIHGPPLIGCPRGPGPPRPPRIPRMGLLLFRLKIIQPMKNSKKNDTNHVTYPPLLF